MAARHKNVNIFQHPDNSREQIRRLEVTALADREKMGENGIYPQLPRTEG